MSQVFDSLSISNLISGAGISSRTPVRIATTGSGTLVSDFENGDSIDGITLSTNDRILIKNQASTAENGIYIVQASGAPVRASDMIDTEDVSTYAIWVKEGTVNTNTSWIGSGVTGTNATFTRYDANGILDVSRGGTSTSTLTANGILIGNGTGPIIAKLSEFNETTAPTASDDSSAGYSVGSRWIDTTADSEYVCLDDSVGAAVWTETTGSGGGGGEANTASNVGAGGVGVFKQKTGVDLEFKNINAGEGIAIIDDVGNDEVDVGLDIDSLTVDGSPDIANDYVATYDSSAGSHKKVLITNLSAPAYPTIYEVISTSSSTTTSTGLVQMPGMTYTPPAGTYLVIFNGHATISNGTGRMQYVFFRNFTYLGNSQRLAFESSINTAGIRLPICTQLQITANGSEAISVRYATSSNSAAVTVFERSMQLIQVS